MSSGTVDPKLLQSMKYRLIGPHRGGRVTSVVGHPSEQGTFYFGACAGGVWKTTDGGAYWENISDGYFNTAAIGGLAISESDPNILWAGTGETSIRGNVSHGDGVYKSTDGGRTWQHKGLKETRHIHRVRIHPTNPDIVYVSALGHAWGHNPERGIYRTTDGGQTWELVLHKSDKAGAIDLAMDMTNPRILYAAFWEAQRYPHALNSGGEDSGIWRSFDGGDSWEDITRNPGLPTGVLGKIGLAASPAKPGRVWALIEAEDGALFRSEDYGATWQRVCDAHDLRRRAWYYTYVIADPSDADTVWVMNLQCWKSIDGGKTFTAIPTPHGDNHDLWIDPKNSDRMIQGNDGGANVTFNGAKSWSTIYNQPTAQLYHVIADNRHPYRVYGSQQDNTSLSLPSQSANGAITMQEWTQPGGGESGYIAIRPDNPDIVFGGAIGSGLGNGRLLRYDNATFEEKIVTVWPEVQGMGRGAESSRYRFQWTFPIELSPHDPNTLYVTSNHVHKSTNEGASWEVISPDLTRNDPEKLKPSGGPISNDNTGAEFYCTIFAFAESPHRAGLLWAGSDDGLVWISRDGGGNWENITPPADILPEWALISIIEPSPHDEAAAYVAATRYKLDDITPYLFKTSDYGKTWTKITDGIPGDDFTRTIREDPNRKGLLYAGTETGVYISFDDGASWQPFRNNLPIVPIHDLSIKDRDLLVATHGRSLWIMDDLSPLYQMSDAVQGQSMHLFKPSTAYRFRKLGRAGQGLPGQKIYGRVSGMMITSYQSEDENGVVEVKYLDAGANPPDGVVIHYWFKEAPQGEVRLTILDNEGNEVKSFSSEGEAKPRVGKQAGANRFVWDMRYPDAEGAPGQADLNRRMADSLKGPVAVPGAYQVRLEANGESQIQAFKIKKDKRVNAKKRELRAQFALLMQVRDKLTETHQAIAKLRRVRDQVNGWSERTDSEAIQQEAETISGQLGEIEDVLIQKDAGNARALPHGLNDVLGGLGPQVANADAAPTAQMQEVYAKVAAEIDQQLARLEDVLQEQVAAYSHRIDQLQLPAVAAD